MITQECNQPHRRCDKIKVYEFFFVNIMNKVAPRDIFNEANFAKSLAQVVRNMQVNDMPGLGMMIRDDADSLNTCFSWIRWMVA